MVYTEKNTCRLCNCPLESVISLGFIYLSTFVDTNDTNAPKIPLELMRCIHCNLMQLHHTVNPEVMYGDYWYQSGLNDSMRIALKDVVDNVKKRRNLTSGSIVVDIGANDGTLLEYYKRIPITVAIEPSKLAQLAKTKCDVVINDFFSAEVYNKHFLYKAHVITAIAMFYDLDNPHTFVEGLRDVLDHNGIIVIQMMDLMSMIKYNDFPNLCHEHLEYYSLDVLNNLMNQHNLQIFDISYNGVNGGSMRAYICHKDARPTESTVPEALEVEKAFFTTIGDVGAYFRNKIKNIRATVVDFVRTANSEGSKVAIMGASTKGNTILQYFGLNDQDIIHAAEINPDKYGKRTVGSNIPIISQQESLASNPDYYLILPWGFIDNFVEKHHSYLANGGMFLVPLPYPRLIGANVHGEIATWFL